MFQTWNKYRKQLTTPCKLITDQSLIIGFQYYNNDCDNVNADFPSNQVGGVSGAIVLGGKFDVYTKPNGGGVSSILTEGSYPTVTTMNIGNDKVQSIRKLHWTSCSSSGRLDDLFAQA